jgi:hypothetical protein
MDHVCCRASFVDICINCVYCILAVSIMYVHKLFRLVYNLFFDFDLFALFYDFIVRIALLCKVANYYN